MNFQRAVIAGITLIAAVVAASLGVVCIQFYLYMDQQPRMVQEWPLLVQVTLGYAALGAIGGLALWSVWRRHAARWLMQALLLLGIVAMIWLSHRLWVS
ncbi:MAG TPA: hypothetical protein VN046_03225 [Stenotrophobium sp.]|jgi:hypothetical protein|nr:hypothetical protein [Stenotrophobium sp.]